MPNFRVHFFLTKKSTLKFGLKNTLQDAEVGDHFEKNHPTNVILKIVENFLNLM